MRLLLFLLAFAPLTVFGQLDFDSVMGSDCENLTFEWSNVQNDNGETLKYVIMRDDNGDNIADELYYSDTPYLQIDAPDFPTTFITCLWTMNGANQVSQSKEGRIYMYEPCCETETQVVIQEVLVPAPANGVLISWKCQGGLRTVVLNNVTSESQHWIQPIEDCGCIDSTFVTQVDTTIIDTTIVVNMDTAINVVSDTLLQARFDSLQAKYDNDIAAYRSGIEQLQTLLQTQKNAVGSLMAELNRQEGWLNKSYTLYDSLQVDFNELEDAYVLCQIALEECEEEGITPQEPTELEPALIYPNPAKVNSMLNISTKRSGMLKIVNPQGITEYNSYIEGDYGFVPRQTGLYIITIGKTSKKVNVLRD